MAQMKMLIDMVYLPGRPVRIKRKGSRPPGVPWSWKETEGIILKAFEMPNGKVMVNVETDVSCGVLPRLYDKDDIELLDVDENILRKNLGGRRVHFPRSSGIGINFPKGASDDGHILSVNYTDGRFSLTLGIKVKGMKGIWVTLADFTQCDLVPCGGIKNG